MVIVTCATCEILASASPLNPYVAMLPRSSNDFSLLVVNRSHTISMSSRCLNGEHKCFPEFKTHLKIDMYPYSASIILYLQQLKSSVFDEDLNIGRASVY